MKKRENTGDLRPSFLFSGKGALCLTLGVILAVASIWTDSLFRLNLIHATSAVKTSDIAPHTVKVSPGAQERWTILPVSSCDARWWIIHTTEMINRGTLRVRETALDGAPEGREVHWSSLLMWVLAGLSAMIGAITGKGILDTVPEAAFYAGPILFAVALAGLGSMVAKRLNLRYALFFCILFATSSRIYQSFRLAECDHHGIVLAFAVACVLAICFGGAGLVAPAAKPHSKRIKRLETFPDLATAKIWFAFSGALGGAALWVSAATMVPVLCACGIGAVGTACLKTLTGKTGSSPHPQIWRLWGLSGCISSLFFYLLEYFPWHFGWRLEVNHPLYAFAWLGAGELVFWMVEYISRRNKAAALPRFGIRQIAAVAFLLAPVAMIFARPDLFFWVSDKFLLALHVDCIQEFQSISGSLHGPRAFFVVVDCFALPAFVLLGSFALVRFCKIQGDTCGLLLFPLYPAMTMQLLALIQIRWAPIALGMWSVCALMVAFIFFSGNYHGLIPSYFRRLLLITLFLAAAFSPLFVLTNYFVRRDIGENLPKDTAQPILLRDIAHQLIQTSSERLPVVLSGVNSSSDLSYYGGIRTLGTLYWENLPGLERAARIFAATTPEEAKQLLLQAGVSHIVVASWDDFGEAYVRLLKKSGKIAPAGETTFLSKIVAGTDCPDWLRPLYYPIPAVFGIADQKVRIFSVLPDQSPLDALVNRGIYFLDAGDYDKAADLLKLAVKSAPQDQRIANLIRMAEAGVVGSSKK